MHSAEHQAAVNEQVLLDQYGEVDNAPAAGFFGTPDDKDFEFIFTGHHVTRRCNAHSDKGLGFGGNPIFYGHYPHPETDMRSNFNEAKEHPAIPIGIKVVCSTSLSSRWMANNVTSGSWHRNPEVNSRSCDSETNNIPRTQLRRVKCRSQETAVGDNEGYAGHVPTR